MTASACIVALARTPSTGARNDGVSGGPFGRGAMRSRRA